MIPQQITYWTLCLKTWIANWVTENTLQEQFGEEECDCCWKQLILANNLIGIMQCYIPTWYVGGTQGTLGDNPITNSTIVLSDNCYTLANEAQIQKIFEQASSIINKNSCK